MQKPNSVQFQAEIIKALDQLATANFTSRTEIARQLVLAGLASRGVAVKAEAAA